MKASIERQLIRWLHLIASVPIVGFIYGPVAEIPQAVFAIRWVIFPAVVLSGLWLWQGFRVKKWLGLKPAPKRKSGWLH